MLYLLGFYMWLFIHRPFEYYPQLGDLQVERIYVIFMTAVWAVSPNKVWAANRLFVAQAIFLVVMIVSWMLSPYADTESVLENYFKVAVFFVLVVTSVRDVKGLRHLLLAYLIAVGLYASHSLLEYANGRIEVRMGTHRMVGVDSTYRDPNAFAYTLLTCLPMTLPFWRDKKTPLGRALLLGFTGLAVLCILLTGSRAGFMGLCFFAVLVLVMARRWKTLLLLGMLAMLVFACLPQNLQDRYLTIVDPSRGPRNAQESAEGRIEGLMDGLRFWQENPVLGLGPVAFFAKVTGRGIGSHNLYGQLLSELGTLGALAFAGVLYCFWRNGAEARRFYRERPEARRGFAANTVSAIGLAIIVMLFLGWAGHNLYRYNWLWLSAFEAVALFCIRTQPAIVAVNAPVPIRPRLPYLLGPRIAARRLARP
jgi:O-antigen ligase